MEGHQESVCSLRPSAASSSFSFLKYLFAFYVPCSFVCIYVSVRALDVLEQELETIVSGHVDAGD